ncbi:MAG: GspH/FimT family pseudopilin [Nitrospirota bacterium]|nr:GspH/FimT family pseudopilin [Nitrospirota bacterium]
MTTKYDHGRIIANGFTLAELLVVIAIIGTLLAIAALQTRTMMDRYTVEGEIKSLHSDLLQARARATQRNRIHFIQFAATSYTITEDTSTGPDGDGSLGAADTQFLQRQLDPRFPLVWSGAVNTIQISAKGLITADQTGTVRLTIPIKDSGEYDCVQISEIRVVTGKWNGTDCIAK